MTTHTPFERTSKRRKGFPSETRVKRGYRVVGTDKHLVEKLGRNDPCPCGSNRKFQEVLLRIEEIRGFRSRRLLLGKSITTPDKALQLPLDSGKHFAGAKRTPASSAAELGR